MSSAKAAEPLDTLRVIGVATVACAQKHALDSGVLRGVT